jgi:phospholipid-binding lipoprotein MlaA
MNLQTSTYRLLKVSAIGLAMVLLQACATGPNANPSDPLEPLNRTVFKLNDGLDRAIFKPVATAYKEVTPSPVRTGINNFFNNISDVWSVVNNALQFKPKETLETGLRVVFNTIFGFAGVLDLGTEMRLARNKQDFGQTLGYWGVESGPYVVLPFFGPSSVRDTVGTVAEGYADLVNRTDRVRVRNSLIGLRVVDKRAEFLGATDVLDQAALDKYSFTRDLYLQRRARSIGRDLPQKDLQPKEERYDLPASPAPVAK